MITINQKDNLSAFDPKNRVYSERVCSTDPRFLYFPILLFTLFITFFPCFVLCMVVWIVIGIYPIYCLPYVTMLNCCTHAL